MVPSVCGFVATHLRRQRRSRNIAEHGGAQHEGRRIVCCTWVNGRCEHCHEAHDCDHP